MPIRLKEEKMENLKYTYNVILKACLKSLKINYATFYTVALGVGRKKWDNICKGWVAPGVVAHRLYKNSGINIDVLKGDEKIAIYRNKDLNEIDSRTCIRSICKKELLEKEACKVTEYDSEFKKLLTYLIDFSKKHNIKYSEDQVNEMRKYLEKYNTVIYKDTSNNALIKLRRELEKHIVAIDKKINP